MAAAAVASASAAAKARPASMPTIRGAGARARAVGLPRLEGAVLDFDGSRSRGASIEVSELGPEPQNIDEVSTPDGRFALSLAESLVGKTPVIRVTRPDRLPIIVHGIEIAAEEPTDLGTLRFVAVGRIEVTVTTPEGRPMIGVRVGAQPGWLPDRWIQVVGDGAGNPRVVRSDASKQVSWYPERIHLTDRNGRVVFPAAPAGPNYVFAFYAQGSWPEAARKFALAGLPASGVEQISKDERFDLGQPSPRQVDLAAGETVSVGITIDGLGEMRGRALRDGAPIPFAALHFYDHDSSSFRLTDLEVIADIDGRFTVRDLAEGPYRIEIVDAEASSKGDHSRIRTIFVGNDGRTTDVDFGGRTALVSVTERESGRAIPNLTVRVAESPVQVDYTEDTFYPQENVGAPGIHETVSMVMMLRRLTSLRTRGIPSPSVKERTVRLRSKTNESGEAQFYDLEAGTYMVLVAGLPGGATAVEDFDMPATGFGAVRWSIRR
jgi:hypothetical protein